jgi:hypothetical protein
MFVPGASHLVDAPLVEPSVEGGEGASCAGQCRPGGYQWAELMRRTCGLDVLACPRCGGRLRPVALIEQASVGQRISRHLSVATEVRPPERLESVEDHSRDTPEFDAAGEGVESREEGCRRVASLLFPDGHFPFRFPPMWP